MMVPPTIAAALEAVTAEAREAGFREGYDQGQWDERERWRRRLRGLLGDAEVAAAADPAPAAPACTTAGPEDGAAAGNAGGEHVNRPDHDNHLAGAACEPAAAVEQAGLEEAADSAGQDDDDEDGRGGGDSEGPLASTEEPGSAPLPALPGPPPGEAPASSPSVVGWQDWRTPERKARLQELWGKPDLSMKSIHRQLQLIEGPMMPVEAENVRHWARKLNLPPRGARPAPPVVAPRPAATPVLPAAAAHAGSQESAQMVRARELLAMGLHPNDIKTAVRLSVAELVEIRRAHAEAA